MKLGRFTVQVCPCRCDALRLQDDKICWRAVSDKHRSVLSRHTTPIPRSRKFDDMYRLSPVTRAPALRLTTQSIRCLAIPAAGAHSIMNRRGKKATHFLSLQLSDHTAVRDAIQEVNGRWLLACLVCCNNDVMQAYIIPQGCIPST